MFGFRQLGQLAEGTRRSLSIDESDPLNAAQGPRPETPDKSLPSSAHLADAALSNLRKSLAGRSASPGRSSLSDRRPNLEDRLRAKFALGDASPSPAVTPEPESVQENPLSPASTPLPESPAISPSASTDPIGLLAAAAQAAASQDQLEAQATPTPEPHAEPPAEETSTAVTSPNDDNASEPIVPAAQEAPEPVVPSLTTPEEPQQISHTPVIDQPPTEDVQEAPTPATSEAPADEPTPQIPVDVPAPAASEAPADAPAPVIPPIVEELIPSEPTIDPVPEVPSFTQDTADVPSSPVKLQGAIDRAPTPLENLALLSRPGTPLSSSTDVEALQKRLKLVEQRFADVSTSFKRLQAEKRAVDSILREITPVEGLQDAEALKDYLQNINQKVEMSQDEIKRLTGKLTRQEERFEELRDTHHLESTSFTQEADVLKQQLAEAQKALQASETAKSQSDAAIAALKTEVEKAEGRAKDEEEKRVKAITLLKTVRQKLVKTEKERDEAGKAGPEVARLKAEIEKGNEEREKALVGLRAHFDRELAGYKERAAREASALRGQFELEAISTRSAHTKEIAARDARITALESSVRTLTDEKNRFFDDLQLRQGEFESSVSHTQTLQAQTAELEYQLREAQERLGLLAEELADARRPANAGEAVVASGVSAAELAAMEARHDARLGEVRRQLELAETERGEAEAGWARRLEEKTREVEELKRGLDGERRTSEREVDEIRSLEKAVEQAREEARLARLDAQTGARELERAREAEGAARAEAAEFGGKVGALEKIIDDLKARETQTRASNKTLREELRKVQSSAALLERQRNPGVGYWSSSRQDLPSTLPPIETAARSSVSSEVNGHSSPRAGSPAPSSATDEELNIEYLRNVILQFLEHPQMRANLVRVLSAILHFTPQEQRRLMAKV